MRLDVAPCASVAFLAGVSTASVYGICGRDYARGADEDCLLVRGRGCAKEARGEDRAISDEW
jgi:hypothetical protein